MKTLRQFLVTMALAGWLLTTFAVPVFAAGEAADNKPLLPLPGSGTYTGIATVAGETAEEKFYNLVKNVIANVRYIIGAVAIAFIIYAGIRMVIAQGKEEEYGKQRMNILWAIIGLALIGMSGELIRIFNVYCGANGKDIADNPCVQGGFLKDPNAILRAATLFDQRTQFLITFIKYFIGSIAIFFVVRSGLRLITIGSNEENVGKDKKNLLYGLIGLGLIIMSDTVINKVFYQVDLSKYPTVGGAAPSFDPGRGVKEVVGFTNILVSIVGPMAVLALLAGGVMYITSGGNEEKQGKAKRVIMATIIGILIIYGAFAIVSTFVGGQFEGGAGPIAQPAST